MKKKNYHTGMINRVRAACRALDKKGSMTRQDIYFKVDPEDSEKKSFSRMWQDLIDRGELICTDTEANSRCYRYNPSALPKADVREKIYRAMHAKLAFCARDIHRLTDADSNYILVLIRNLVKHGHLEFTGKTAKGNIFRVKNNNKFYQELVRGV